MSKHYLENTVITLKNYKIFINEILGSGSFAKVYNGVCNLTGKIVAIKVVPKYKLRTYGAKDRIFREIDISEQVSHHPNIPTFYEHFEDMYRHYLVFEKIDGIELFQYLVDNGKLDEEKARDLFIKILEVVEFLHSKGICHRDIKIENIMIGYSQKLKVCETISDVSKTLDFSKIYLVDFGFAIKTSNANVLNEKCGSHFNYPPELCEFKLYNGFKYDIWTLGNILYVILVGRRAFASESEHEVTEKIKFGNYNETQDITPEARKLIERIFVVESLHRPIVSEILNDPWVTKI